MTVNVIRCRGLREGTDRRYSSSPIECRGKRGGQRVGRFEAGAEQAGCLGIKSRNPGSGFDHQNAARQAFENTAQAFADTVVLFQTGRQVAVRDFQFLAKMSHLPL